MEGSQEGENNLRRKKNRNEKMIVYFGGTFDHLHLGHELMIDTAFSFNYPVFIGLTSRNTPGFCEKRHFGNIQIYEKRKTQLEEYLKLKDYRNYRIGELTDRWGEAKSGERGLIVVSQDTFAEVAKINEYRNKNCLESLIVVVIPFVRDSDGQRYTSTILREKITKKDTSLA